MIYRFGPFVLDTMTRELREADRVVHVEPQVFALLLFLVENRERLVTKDEIIETVWGGRFISDSALASRVKAARAALGDNGRAQTHIRTAHGLGLRFVAAVSVLESPPRSRVEEPRTGPATEGWAPMDKRPRIAVLPLRALGADAADMAIADALPQDLITALSRLRWLFVIARGSSFRFRSGEGDLSEIRRALSIGYCLSGTAEIVGGRMILQVELADAEREGIIWAERFDGSPQDVHEIREEIVRQVIAALEIQVPAAEAARARLKSPAALDAWSAYHLGLEHMYRFTAPDNAKATGYFEAAVAREPGFARGHAGLSFTHFQTAFLRYGPDPEKAKMMARRAAEAALECDPLDPFATLTMGRALWLEDDLEASLPWIERAAQLNPNYAQAQYSRAWTEALLGTAEASVQHVDEALALSPLDPLRYGMLGVHALLRLGQDTCPEADVQDAAAWAERAALAPGAHALISLIAVAANDLAGNGRKAEQWAALARKRRSDVTATDFFAAFPFRSAAARRRIEAALARHGL